MNGTATAQNQSVAVQASQMPAVDFFNEDQYGEGNIELIGKYLGTQDGDIKKGDKFLVMFQGVSVSTEIDDDTGEEREVETVMMISKDKESGSIISLRNSTSVLVSNVKRLIQGGQTQTPAGQPVPFWLTYLGKEKGASYSYDNWSIKPAVSKA